MTHHYESEILNKLMERDGFNIPSSVPPYEAEIKAYLIEQVKLAYPKLNDYEAEWLLYNYTKHIPAEFPIETITNVTDATVNNVVPYAYKSAILKGNTLVNISPLSGEITIKPNSVQFVDSPFIKSDTTFTISFNCSSVPTTGFIEFRQFFENTALKIENKPVVQGYNQFKVITVSSEINRFRFKNEPTSETDFTFNNLMIIEGDYTNVHIPFFEGMKSVKMPVLTTYGVKNIFTTSINQGVIAKDGTFLNNDTGCYTDIIEVIPNTKCVISNNLNLPYDRFAFYDINGKFMSRSESYYSLGLYEFTVPNNAYFIRITLYNGGKTLKKDEFTYFEVKTIDKTNILTVNEEVELRGIGEVKDELNCLTGELTQRVGEIVVDGSQQELVLDKSLDNTLLIIFTSIKTGLSSDSVCICDKLPFKANSSEDFEHMRLNSNGNVSFWINKTKFEELNTAGVKKYLQQNPITVQYPLATESVKTVDLNVVDESGNEINHFMPIEGTMHIQTDGEPVKPSVTMEIPVEATTQNLASFIEMEV